MSFNHYLKACICCYFITFCTFSLVTGVGITCSVHRYTVIYFSYIGPSRIFDSGTMQNTA